MTTTVFNRKMKSGIANATQSGSDPAVFDSTGIAEVADAVPYLAQYGGLELPGTPGMAKYLDVAGDAAATVIAVPTGKTWRILSLVAELACDATVANRNLTIGTYTDGDVKIEEWAQANAVASSTTRYQIVFQDSTLGNLRTEPAGTLTMSDQPGNNSTITINGVALTWKTALTGAANELKLGTNVAGSVIILNAAIGITPEAGDHSVSDAVRDSLLTTQADMAGDDMVITYAGTGSASVDGEAITIATTSAGGGNGVDAATLGTTTAGVDAGTDVGTYAFPTTGILLPAGYYVNIVEPTTGDAGDDIDIFLTYIEYDETIT